MCCWECSVLCHLPVFNAVIEPNTEHRGNCVTQISNDETAGTCNTLHCRSILGYLLSQDSTGSFLTTVRRSGSKRLPLESVIYGVYKFHNCAARLIVFSYFSITGADKVI